MLRLYCPVLVLAAWAVAGAACDWNRIVAVAGIVAVVIAVLVHAREEIGRL